MAAAPEVPPKFTNRLAGETSPYLLQHAHNPVDWYPWGEEALARARTEDKPIFLSIGYSACHWCHVMERESFENEQIAKILNDNFVAIKVDREERPDIDEIYMTAVVALTGSGGWPMSVWLTPALKPFYGGTYYPPVDLYGRPGFPTVLMNIADAWKNRRAEVDQSAVGITEYVQAQLASGASIDSAPLDAVAIAKAVDNLTRSFDSADGGWGGAPKFPSSASIHVLLRAYRRTQDPKLLHMATFTLEKMGRGGMYDQIGGGFHRYSVDGEWLVPHFEKMLYDNAQLASAYLEAYQVTKQPFFKRIATEIFEYELRDMRDGLGAFHSTEDADSEGEEGKFYVWTRLELIDLLGTQDAELFCAYYGVLPGGNFESHEKYHGGKNILHVPQDPAEVAKNFGLSEAELASRMAPLRAKVLAKREKRARPALDDKVLTAWNGLMISALAQGAAVLDEPRYRDAAMAAGDFILTHMQRDGVLLRTHRKGESRLEAYLDDYAFAANGFVDLYEATFESRWLNAAEGLTDRMMAHFWDPVAKNLYYTSDGHKHLIVRTKPTYDGAEPSGNSIAALLLQRLGHMLGKPQYLDAAQGILASTKTQYEKAPQAYLRMICALDFLVFPPQEIAIIGAPGDANTQALLRAVRQDFVPNKVVMLHDPAQAEATEAKWPLIAGKTLIDRAPAAYVCRNFTCDKPLTDAAQLTERLAR